MEYHDKESGTPKGFTRRSFLGGSALAALGVSAAAAGVLNGCSPASKTEDAALRSEGKGNQKASSSELNPQDYDYQSNSIELTTLFSEVKIGSLTLPHRMVKSAAGSDTQNNQEEIIAYYRNFAQGGVGLIWVEDCVDMYGNFPNKRKIAKDAMPFTALVDAVHAEGSYVGYQLSCMGGVFSGTPPAAPGALTSAVAGDLTAEEIKLLQEDTIAAARYLKEAGFDAVEYNAAGNNLGQSFLSRMRNKREDAYGPQNFENRTRFITEIVKGIKEACGKDFTVQVLINGIEENDEPLGDNSLCTTVEENCIIAKLLEEAGADSLHVRLGPIKMHVCQFASDLYFTGYGIDGTTGCGTQFDFKNHWQGRLMGNHSGCGIMLGVAQEIKSAVSIPVGTVTYMDPAHAPDFFEGALKEGKVDFLLMNRPLTVDTEYVHKLQEGRLDEIAPCTRCMHCHFDYNEAGKMYEHCRVNACTQRAFRSEMPEGYALPPKQGDKRVMVIGGGPAGMETARVAALRGYRVKLYEKNASVGGLLEFASMVKGPHENLEALRVYLSNQLTRVGVTVVTGKEVDADLISEEVPDVVVFAMGGLRDSLNLKATAGTSLVSLPDFLTAPIGEHVTLVGANAQAVDAALYLMAQGKKITLVCSDSVKALGKGQSSWVKTFVMPMLYARGVKVWSRAEVTSVGEGEISIKSESGAPVTIPCDTLIEAMDMLPQTALADAVKDAVEVHLVGDCKKPWNIAEAITAGNLVARAL